MMVMPCANKNSFGLLSVVLQENALRGFWKVWQGKFGVVEFFHLQSDAQVRLSDPSYSINKLPQHTVQPDCRFLFKVHLMGW